jgi:hypothetical protein
MALAQATTRMQASTVSLLMRLLLTCGLWLALLGEAQAFSAGSIGGTARATDSVATLAAAASAGEGEGEGEAPVLAWDQKSPSAQAEKAKGDSNVVDRLAVALSVPRLRPTRESSAAAKARPIGCLAPKAPRFTANARAPPSRLAEHPRS